MLGMGFLAGPVELWPMTPEKSGPYFFKLSSHCFNGRLCLRLASSGKFCSHSLIGFHLLVAASQKLPELNILLAMRNRFLFF
jgi:hypothetical protein